MDKSIQINEVYEMKQLLKLIKSSNLLVIEKDKNHQKKLIGHMMDRYQVIDIIEDDIYVHELENDAIENRIGFKGIIYVKMVDPKKL